MKVKARRWDSWIFECPNPECEHIEYIDKEELEDCKPEEVPKFKCGRCGTEYEIELEI